MQDIQRLLELIIDKLWVTEYGIYVYANASYDI
jgi:hypothetical protein